MKKAIYILLFLTIGFINAQYTLIPDSNFESELVIQGYDNAVDGQVLTANIQNIISLSLTWSFIYDLTGIQDFTALEVLVLENNNLTTIDLSQNTNLKNLYLDHNDLISLDLTGNPNLEVVKCKSQIINGNEFTLLNVDVSQCYSLMHLELGNNRMPSNINVSNSPNLEYLNLGGSIVTSLDLTNNPNLVYLSLWDNHVTSLDLSQNTLLTELDLGATRQLDNIDLTNNINLEILRCYGVSYNLIELDLTNNINLKFFRFSQAQSPPNIDLNTGITTEIDFTHNTALEYLYMSQCNIKDINLSNCPNLILMDLFWMYQISSLNLKNGFNENIEDIGVNEYSDTPNLLTCIEVDDADAANAEIYPYDTFWASVHYFYDYSEDCSALSLDDITLEEDIKLYPNPAKNNFNIISNTSSTINNILICNQLGKIVKKANNTYNVDINNLEKGIYFVKIEFQDNQTITKKIIKN